MSQNDFSDDNELLELLDDDLDKKSLEPPQSSKLVKINRNIHINPHAQNALENLVQYENIVEDVVSHPIAHKLNYDNLQTYIYPSNLEVRDYQFDIVKKALFNNLLCALPTGLGKTFIASTVMLNYFRWTTEAKIIFMAPTRPLVAQQIKACYGITGIPPEQTAILLDKTKRNRAEIWKEKRVFFTTPQVVENDLSGGLLDPKQIVCLIVDEAHRAKGNYSYTKVVQFIKRFNTSFRVLALSATPSADIEGVQQIIDNLMISKVEVRTESSPDTAKYMKTKQVEKVDCEVNENIRTITGYICEAILPVLRKANEAGIYDITDPARINAFQALEKSRKVVANPSLSEGIKWTYYFILQLLGEVGQFLRRLNVYGIKTFYSFFTEKYVTFTTKYDNKKSTNKLTASFYYHNTIKQMDKFCKKLIEENEAKSRIEGTIEGVYSHPKLEYLVSELEMFFSRSDAGDSKVIIFTEFRESALEIVKVVENANKVIHNPELGDHPFRPHIFIGQAKEKDRFDKTKYLKSIAPKKRGKKRKQDDIEVGDEDGDNDAAGTKGKRGPKKERPTDRIGSSEDAQARGMNQALQKELLHNFKSGKYNVLVATSIGEEGLDIGEVDLIVCYDSTSSPIKNIQRMGRTGRKRDGKVILLLSGNERTKFEKAMDNYEWIQRQIEIGNAIKFYISERIIPDKYEPYVEKMLIEIPKENEEILEGGEGDDEFLKKVTKISNKKKNVKESGPKQQKLEKMFFIPNNVETGFKKASKLVKKVSDFKIAEDNVQDPKKQILSDFSDEDDNDFDELTPDALFGSSISNKNVSSSIKPLDQSSQMKASTIAIQKEDDKENYIVLPSDSDFDSDDDIPMMRKYEKKNSNAISGKTSINDELVIQIKNAKRPSREKETTLHAQADTSSESISVSRNLGSGINSSPLIKKREHVIQDKLKANIKKVSIISQIKRACNLDPVISGEFKDKDGFLSEKQEEEFVLCCFDSSFTGLNTHTVNDPVISIQRGLVEGHIGHSEKSYNMINFLDMARSDTEINKLENSLQEFHERNQIFKFNDEYRLYSTLIVSEDEDKL
ncbi:nucleotide binding protein [[Candida] boidinii]|nr:nucleotide binding protein [[Candida] boidinii]